MKTNMPETVCRKHGRLTSHDGYCEKCKENVFVCAMRFYEFEEQPLAISFMTYPSKRGTWNAPQSRKLLQKLFRACKNISA